MHGVQFFRLQVPAHEGLDVLEGDAREERDVFELGEEVGGGGDQIGALFWGWRGGEGGVEDGGVVEGLEASVVR